MNPTSKLDLDALLKSWPAPARDEHAWEERADAIVRAALEASEKATSESLQHLDLFEAPSLAAEPGETQAPIASAGEKKMSQESDQSASSTKPEPSPASVVEPVSAAPPKSTERKRGSLKELAARASQAGVASRPGSMNPPAPASRASVSTLASGAVPTAPLSRPIEAGLEDSGIVNLNAVKANATPEQVAAAEKAKPAASGLFEEAEEKPAVAASTVKAAAPVTAIAAARPADKEKKKGSGGLVAGAVIAVLGLAAAFAITKMNKPDQPAQPVVATDTRPSGGEVKVAPTTVEPAGPAPMASTEAIAAPATTGDPAEAAPSGGGEGKVATAPASGGPSGASAAGAEGKPAGADAKSETTETKPGGAVAGATPAKPAGDLQGAMEQAVGSSGKKDSPSSENAEPAAGMRNQNIPEQPSQGSVQAATRSVIGGAKACVAGADDVSRAQITFSASGAVSNVSVTGWAASHGATGCIKAALQPANVGPFSKSSFTVGVTIRP